MNKYTRLGTSCLTMIGLHIAAAGILYGMWNLSIDDKFVVSRLLEPNYVNDNAEANIAFASEIVSFIYSAFFHLTMWSIAVSFLWLAISTLAQIEQPGHAKKLSWLWVLLMIVGTGGTFGIFGYYFLEFGDFAGQTDLLAEDKRIPLTLVWGFVFLIFYILCGTFFTTQKIARTAVPFAAHVIRS
jgi:hypothetical protein